MYETGYYPMGAEHDPSAPWNEKTIPPVTKQVDYTQVLSKETCLEITDYNPGHAEKVWDDGGWVVESDDDDFSDTDWLGEYKSDKYTPLELITILRNAASELSEGRTPAQRRDFWKRIVEECDGWTAVDEECEEAI